MTKQPGDGIPAGEEWGFTLNYTSGAPASYNATKSVSEIENGLKFTLKADEKIRIDFEADPSFRFEVTEDDPSKLTNITGTGGTADMTAQKFTSSGGASKVTFTNGTTPPPTPTPTPGKSILFKRDANTNAGVGPATFKFSSVVNGDYEFDTDASGALETIQWWDPTEAEGKYIKPGEYAVSEIVPPSNYLPTSEVQQIKLELDADGNPIPAGPLVFRNLAKVGLRIVKYDRQSHGPMNGVTFEVFKDSPFNLLPNTFQEPFPFLRDGRFAVQRFMDGTVDLRELLGRKQPILRYQTGPGGEVQLGLFVVLKVMTPAESGFSEVPFPGGKLYAIPGRLARQHRQGDSI